MVLNERDEKVYNALTGLEGVLSNLFRLKSLYKAIILKGPAIPSQYSPEFKKAVSKYMEISKSIDKTLLFIKGTMDRDIKQYDDSMPF